MISLIDKVASLLPALEERGTVYLFAFAERNDFNRWDIVLSSDWSDKDWPGAVRCVIDLLWPQLEPWEKSMIALIAVIPSGNARMQEMSEDLDGVTPEDKKVVEDSLLGSDVRRAFVFKGRHPPAPAANEPLAATAGMDA